jgi:hypothetical protein
MISLSNNTVSVKMVPRQAQGFLFGERGAAHGGIHQLHRKRQGQLRHLAPGGGREQVGQRHQRHVVMPTRLGAGFAVGHPKVAFSVPEELFHTRARAGGQGQPCLFVGVEDVKLHFRFFREAAADDQPVLPRKDQFLNKCQLDSPLNLLGLPRRECQELLQSDHLLLPRFRSPRRLGKPQRDPINVLLPRAQQQAVEINHRMPPCFLATEVGSEPFMKLRNLPCAGAHPLRRHRAVILTLAPQKRTVQFLESFTPRDKYMRENHNWWKSKTLL